MQFCHQDENDILHLTAYLRNVNYTDVLVKEKNLWFKSISVFTVNYRRKPLVIFFTHMLYNVIFIVSHWLKPEFLELYDAFPRSQNTLCQNNSSPAVLQEYYPMHSWIPKRPIRCFVGFINLDKILPWLAGREQKSWRVLGSQIQWIMASSAKKNDSWIAMAGLALEYHNFKYIYNNMNNDLIIIV